jgi:DNA-binding MarR family transcriptional regulator
MQLSQMRKTAVFDLEQFLPYRLYQATENSSQGFREVYKQLYGLTRAEWRVLFNVGQYGPISANEIVQRTYLDKTKISRAVQKLVEQKWLRRSNDLADRRRQALELTARGKKVMSHLIKLAEEHNARIVEIIGENRLAEFLNVLGKIEAADFGSEMTVRKAG